MSKRSFYIQKIGPKFSAIFLTFAIVFAFFDAAVAASGPGPFFTYIGILTDNSGTPIAESQTLTFQIIEPPSCIVYEETQTITPDTNGEFSVIVGTGERVDDTANSSAQIFATQGSVNCYGSTSQAVSGLSKRAMHIKVGSVDLNPDVIISNVPFAINSQTAQKLEDKVVNDFLLKVGIPSCSAGTYLTWNGSSMACANAGIVSQVTSSSSDIAVAFSTSTPLLTLNSGTAANQIVKLDGAAKLPAVDGSLLINLDPGQLSSVVGLTKGGTGATNAAGARTNLGLGTVATQNTGSTAGSVPLLGAGGLAANKMCTSDGSGASVECIANVPISSQWTTNISDIYYNVGKVGIGVSPTHQLEVQDTVTPQRRVWFNDLSKDMFNIQSNEGEYTGIEIKNTTGSTRRWGFGVAASTSTMGPYYGFLIRDLSVNSTRFVVNASGNVGIGTISPSTKLQVDGTISPAIDNTSDLGTSGLRFANVYATIGSINTSDRRQKKNVLDSDLGLDFINKLRPVSYRWKSGSDKEIHYGLIAQETEKVINESRKPSSTGNAPIVVYDKKTDRYGLRYSELISPLIKAVQEFYKEWLNDSTQIHEDLALKADKSEVEELRMRAEKAEAENAAIKNENAAIKAYLCSKDSSAGFCK